MAFADRPLPFLKKALSFHDAHAFFPKAGFLVMMRGFLSPSWGSRLGVGQAELQAWERGGSLGKVPS